MIDTRAHPSRVGFLLVACAAGVELASVWLLPASRTSQLTTCGTAVVMATCALAWHALTRHVTHPFTLLAYPLIIFVGLAVVGSSTTGVGSTYTGFITMAFIYIGLYSPPRTILLMLPPAAISWLGTYGALTHAPVRSLEVRLPIALIIWLVVAGLLSQHVHATRRSAATLRREAQRDPLTGLRNRRVMTDVLADAGDGDTVVVLDLDHFKTVNDDRGHSAGDDLLLSFARVLVRCVRDQDLAVRFGGDEFLIFLPNTSIAAAERILSRLKLEWAQHSGGVTFSAGIASVRVGRDGTDAFGEADRLLYEAKAAGRDRWAVPASVVRVPHARVSPEASTAPQPTPTR